MRLLTIVFVLLLSACALRPVPEESAWMQIERVTDAVYLGNDRLKLTTDKPFLLGAEGLEYAMLARAAREARERGAESFAIVRVDYHQRLALLGEDDLLPLGRTWIGTYEDLLAHREQETERFGKLAGMTWVVALQDEAAMPLRRTFASDETYEALLAAWIEERDL